jgi:hypothetical protein
MRVPDLAQGDRIDQIDVLGYQRRKRLLGIALGIFPNQGHVIAIHAIGICMANAKTEQIILRILRAANSESQRLIRSSGLPRV